MTTLTNFYLTDDERAWLSRYGKRRMSAQLREDIKILNALLEDTQVDLTELEWEVVGAALKDTEPPLNLPARSWAISASLAVEARGHKALSIRINNMTPLQIIKLWHEVRLWWSDK